jgi:hypothetical protein
MRSRVAHPCINLLLNAVLWSKANRRAAIRRHTHGALRTCRAREATNSKPEIAVFWFVAPCSLVEIYQRFRGPCCLHHQGDESCCFHHQGDELLFVLMMEAARTSETLVNFYQTTGRYNPEDSHLRSHRLENLKSY